MLRTIAIILLLAACLVPSIYVLVYGLFNFSVPWISHLWLTVLPDYFVNSGVVSLIAVVTALVIGAVPAWILHYYDFSGRKFISFLQILPLALPAYVTAGIFIEAFPSQFFHTRTALAIEIGASVSPFAYLILRIFLARIPRTLSDVSATLGVVAWNRFFRLYLPLLAAPVLLIAALVGSEALSDFGAATRVGVKTFSIGLHHHWLAVQKPDIAAALSYILFFVVLVLAIPFAWLFLRSPLQNVSMKSAHYRTKLEGVAGLKAKALVLLLLVPGLFLPMYFVLKWAAVKIGYLNLTTLYPDVGNSVGTALMVVLLCAVLTFLFLLLAETGIRLKNAERSCWFLIVNYVLPSTIIGFAFFNMGGVGSPLRPLLEPIQDTRLVIVLACVSRFLPFLLLLVMENLSRVPTSIPDAARTLGYGKFGAFFHAVLPLNRTPFAAGMLIIFIESVKELNFSLMLQPFDYANVSIRVFKYANLHMAQESSVWVLCLVLICVYPIWTLSRFLDREGVENA